MTTNFSQEDTKVAKGVAVCLMLIHHLWAFPQRLPGGELEYLLHFFGESSISYIGSFGKICVSLFYFLGGYGLYLSRQRGTFDLVGRIKNLYINYWKVFVIFVPIAFLFFSDQPPYCESEYVYSKFSEFSYRQLVENFFGISDSYNSEWWFFRSYVIAVTLFTLYILFPYITKSSNRFLLYSYRICIVIFSIFLTDLFVLSFWTGCLMAKYQAMARLRDILAKNNLLSPLHCLFFLGAIVYARTSVSGPVLDIVYAPLFIIFSITLLNTLPFLKKIFQHMGAQSTNMWLIHTFYCYYFYEIAKFIVAPRYAILSLLLLAALSYISAVAISKFWTYVECVYHRFITPKMKSEKISI